MNKICILKNLYTKLHNILREKKKKFGSVILFVQYLIAVAMVVLLELITGVLGLVYRNRIVS